MQVTVSINIITVCERRTDTHVAIALC